jgi:uncharacterized protein (DUF1810 family)
MADVDLARFLEVHDDVEGAIAEIRAGRKRTHWMWYVFPQLAGLGRSEAAQHYAIRSRDEAVAFLPHPILGAGYRRAVEEVWRQVVEHGASITKLFGSPDDVKLVSSLTLFAGVACDMKPEPGSELAAFIGHADQVLEAASVQGLPRCVTTERYLRE